MSEHGTLGSGEPHPLAYDAKEYIASLPMDKLILYQESYASCSLSGNRAAEICSETLRRLLTGQSVSDRYLLGLAWSIRNMEDKEK